MLPFLPFVWSKTWQAPRSSQMELYNNQYQLRFSPSAQVNDASRFYTTDLMAFLDEIALYDRQIRLWGVKAQEK